MLTTALVTCRCENEPKEFEALKSSVTEHDQFVIKWHYDWSSGAELESPPKDMMDLRGLVHDKAKLDEMLKALRNRREILEEKRQRERRLDPRWVYGSSSSG